MSAEYTLECVQCGKEADESVDYTNCIECKAPLDVVLDYEKIKATVSREAYEGKPLKAIKYLDLYPIKDASKIVTLGAGGTPFYHCENLGKQLGLLHLYIKFEGANPTGAFKDRGTLVEVAKAKEMGKKAIIVASTGNMAASISAYCAKAQIPAYILVPQGTPVGKMAQTLAYGARIIQVRGSYDDAAALAKEISEKNDFYLAGDYAFRSEGQKSQAYEIVEQMNWDVPDTILVPIGCGTNSSAIHKGFKEFKELGFTNAIPKIIGVQSTGANPVVQAFNNKAHTAPVLKNPKTIASAMCVGDPLDGLKILKAIEESGGAAYDVADEEILEAEKLLAKTESFFVEPSAAATLAVLKNLVAQGKINKDEKIVLLLTGAGLKDPVSALKVLYTPPVVDPQFSEVEKYLTYGFYDIVATESNETILFESVPTIDALQSTIKDHFNASLHDDDLEKAHLQVIEFLEKGKAIMKGDMQNILEKTLRESAMSAPVLKLVDYKVSSNRAEKPVGYCEVEFRGEVIKQDGEGTGPVDCLLNAIRSIVTTNGFSVNLKDYEVNIVEGSTAASVNVKMKLEDNANNSVIAMGTNPDIIAASVEAFIEGYNILYYKNKQSQNNS